MPLSPLRLAQELIRFKTVNPPGDERPCAQHLGNILESAGFNTTMIPFGEGRAQLIARIGGSVDKPPLCFTGHLDTVPLGAQPWSVDPISADIKNGKLYGRGSSDMKSGVAAFIAAAVDLADRWANKLNFVLVITAGEETGCTGAADLARRGDWLGKAGAIVVAEPTSNLPLAGHKGALWLMAKTQGVTAHGSMPEKGVNAIYKAARAITALEQFDFNVARHEVMGAPTLNVGTVQSGLNINSVPDRAVIGIDIRTLPAQRHAGILEQLESYLGADVTLDTLVDVESVWTEPSDPWMRNAFDIACGITGKSAEVGAAPYFTDASVLTPAFGSPPTLILGPGELVLAHQTDEYCMVDRIDEAAAIYTALMRKWCLL
jgi:succinyl-diaminopimelate desuccinylase